MNAWLLIGIVLLAFLIAIIVGLQVKRSGNRRQLVAQVEAARPSPAVPPVAAPTPPPPAPEAAAPQTLAPIPVPPARTPLAFLQKAHAEPPLEVTKSEPVSGTARVTRMAEEQWDSLEVVTPRSRPTAAPRTRTRPEPDLQVPAPRAAAKKDDDASWGDIEVRRDGKERDTKE